MAREDSVALALTLILLGVSLISYAAGVYAGKDSVRYEQRRLQKEAEWHEMLAMARARKEGEQRGN